MTDAAEREARAKRQRQRDEKKKACEARGYPYIDSADNSANSDKQQALSREREHTTDHTAKHETDCSDPLHSAATPHTPATHRHTTHSTLCALQHIHTVRTATYPHSYTSAHFDNMR